MKFHKIPFQIHEKICGLKLDNFAKKIYAQRKTGAFCHAMKSREDLWHYNTRYTKYSLKHVQLIFNMAASLEILHVTVQCKRL